MSTKYPGGIISKTAPIPSGPYADSTAPGVWTLEQQAYWQKLGQWPTAGNVNPNAFIENLFSTYLYTGTGAAQTITNGIDISTNGGLVWSKSRSAVQDHSLIDTVRGNGSILYSNLASAADTGVTTGITAFNTTGYALGSGSFINQNAATYASWTFRKQAKFFDIVTWTGDDTYGRAIPHNLGSTPGCFIIKCTSNASTDWIVYHSALGVNSNVYLNSTTDAVTGNNFYNGVAPTSTNIYVGSSAPGSNGYVNQSGRTYVAYLFASNAGGFGLTGTDNVISCGSGTVGTEVNLGYEPQFVIMKRTTLAGQWYMLDNMRGWNVSGDDQYVSASSSGAESAGDYGYPTATGFYPTGFGSVGNPFIYIAIRRGPMAVPTSGTSVYGTTTWVGSSGTKTTSSPTANFATGYAAFVKAKDYGQDWGQFDQLRGVRPFLSSDTTSAEINDGASAGGLTIWPDTIYLNGGSYFGGGGDGTGKNYLAYLFKRAPGFFDEVCYTGTNTTGPSIPHNLGVAPELMIVKNRTTATTNWWIYSASLGNTSRLIFTNAAVGTGTTVWNSTSPTSSVFTVGTPAGNTNGNTSETFVAYLFATCAGVSKVGSYTGTGSTQTISCGFTGGARFVLIKRTDSTGDWCVWDTARGMVSGTDPRLFFNSASAEYNNDWVYTTTGGFQIVTSDTNVNASGGTYIFLAIA